MPALREAAVIADTITHMEAIAVGHRAQVVIATTAREQLDAAGSPGTGTVEVVEKLAAAGTFVHLHYPDPRGLKGDQLNFAASYCASTLLGDGVAEDAFLLCYDADSRPPLDSLQHFTQAMRRFPEADVLHQSSRFELRELRERDPAGGPLKRLARAVCDGGAVRANRFVLGFEIPRLLNRSTAVGRRKRAACSYVYAHVTGHGLCVRLSSVLDLPFPSRSPLEDMHYSFYLCSRGMSMVAVPSLDRAEVPDTVRGQVEQASRWFFGPGRALRYLRDPATRRGPRAVVQAASALGSAAEWLGCAVIPPLMLAAAWLAAWPLRGLPLAVIALYLAQVLLTEACLGAPARPGRRLARVLACPPATVFFGLGGFIGAAQLVRGGSGVGKTERR